jgi:subtilase family serine protease
LGLTCLLAVGGSTLPAWAEEGAADLSVSIAWGSGGTPHVQNGDTATWTLTVTNLGDATASSVDVVAGGSDQFGQFTVDCGEGVIEGDYCVLGDLQPGESRTVTISATAFLIGAGTSPTRRTWWVTGAAWTATDPDLSNNTATLDVRITGSPQP